MTFNYKPICYWQEQESSPETINRFQVFFFPFPPDPNAQLPDFFNFCAITGPCGTDSGLEDVCVQPVRWGRSAAASSYG